MVGVAGISKKRRSAFRNSCKSLRAERRVLIILKNDPTQYTAVGFTELLEVMAMARPVILTRTGALPTEIDVEKAGCGLHVPPEDRRRLHEL